ncbi:MAG: UDP-glucose 4-epimerase GalE [Roseibium album]|uniref:UDP-glucose 4-epimerase GalE n=1 Tax=Roseibium album TaxID=311410 RepID=UPI0032ED6B16
MTEVLVTGGAGYIGSHMCVELLQAGYDVVVADNLSNSSARSLQAVQRITQKPLSFVEMDIRDEERLAALFRSHRFDAVLHFAGLKAVAESVAEPLRYYDNNVNGTLRLVEAMSSAGVKTLVFSSSATVYGTQERVPIDESAGTAPTNPYGRTKLQVEQLLHDLGDADAQWRISLLRYFNPVGAHPSGEIGEDPNDIPNNLMPYIAQVAIGRLPCLRVFGDDYATADGTGVRDYIHVVDLVNGHLRALDYLQANTGVAVHNLGSGRGHSVLEVIAAFERASGRPIAHEVVARRPGDVARSFADPGKANRELNWTATHDLERICQDAWKWQTRHPDGYRTA